LLKSSSLQLLALRAASTVSIKQVGATLVTPTVLGGVAARNSQSANMTEHKGHL